MTLYIQWNEERRNDRVIVFFNFKYPQLSDVLCNGVSRLSTVF